MTAFVRRLPQMTAAQYQALTQAGEERRLPGVAPATLSACTSCHGVDGRGREQSDIPVLAGQSASYLVTSKRQYVSGKRSSAVMQTELATTGREDMKRLASYFSAMPGLKNNATSPSSPRLDRFGQPLPACSNCHAAGKAAPILAGQKPGYLAARLRLWQQDDNVIDARLPPDTMAMIARRIPVDQIDELARTVAQPGSD